MLALRSILFRGIALALSAVALAACGQKGALYLPNEPAAAGRATLPQALKPGQNPNTPPASNLPAPPEPK